MTTHIDQAIERFKQRFAPVPRTDSIWTNYKTLGVYQERALESFLRQEIEIVTKAFGGCTNCYGKGYSTYYKPGHTVSTDLPDHLPIKRHQMSNPQSNISFCTCERGKSLKKELEALEKKVREDERKRYLDFCLFWHSSDTKERLAWKKRLEEKGCRGLHGGPFLQAMKNGASALIDCLESLTLKKEESNV